MVHYIFWPEHIYEKKANDALCVISILLESGDHMVIDSISDSLFRKQGFNGSILPPYYYIGRKNKSQWTLNIEGFTVIRFVAPELRSMQFLSLEPLLLTLPERRESPYSTKAIDLLFEYKDFQVDGAIFKESINQINLYYNYLVDFERKYPQLCCRALETSTTTKVFDVFYLLPLYKLFHRGVLYLTILTCFLAGQISSLLNNSLFPLLRISVTIRQIDLRCQQICYFPVQYLRINKNRMLSKLLPRVENSKPRINELPCRFYPDYIRFYNTIWLMINDVSFGLILGAICMEHKGYIVKLLKSSIRYCLYDFVKKITINLAANPFGIKLNAELTHFLSDLFTWINEYSFLNVTGRLTTEEMLSKVVHFISNVMSCMGATFGLSLLVDFLTLCSFHVLLFYHIINKLYSWQLNAMTNLYYLFRGKKKNKLRQRIDFNYFELDQLLMGTLLFIIMVYLTPTLLAFYISYTILRLCLIYVEIGLESMITLINHFPLFALLLRVKDPKRLPGGISFDISSDELGSLLLRNNPLKLNMLFKPFNIVLNQVIRNYCSFHTILTIISGKPIIMDRNELYYVLYSSLPEKWVNIQDISSELQETLLSR